MEEYKYDEESVNALVKWAETATFPEQVMLSDAENIFDVKRYVRANLSDIAAHYPDEFYNPAITRLYRLKDKMEGKDNADSNEYAYGYDVMMAKKICDELGYDLQIVRLDWDSLIPAIQSGQVDCVIAGQSITEERLQAVDFSEPYYYATIVTLVKQDGKYADAKSVADLAGATCTSQQSTIWYQNCLPQIPDANILAATASAPDMLMSLNADKCDLVVTDQPTGKGALVAYPNFKMLEFGGGDDDFQVSDEDINIGISMKKGNTELKEAIDSVLTKMTKDDFSAMMDEAISVQPLAN